VARRNYLRSNFWQAYENQRRYRSNRIPELNTTLFLLFPASSGSPTNMKFYVIFQIVMFSISKNMQNSPLTCVFFFSGIYIDAFLVLYLTG